MALVDYSDSSSSSEDDHSEQRSQSLKRKRDATLSETDAPPTSGSVATDLPPLPSKFHDLYASSTRITNRDDPRLHGGRTRAIPHIEGNWATHVSLEWHPSISESSYLSSLLSKISSAFPDLALHGFLTSDLGAPSPLHISLSRPIVLVTEQREAFLDLVTGSVKKSGVRPRTETRERGGGAPRRSNGRPGYGRDRRPGSEAANTRDPSLTFDGPVEASHPDRSGHFHISIGWMLHEPPPEVVAYTSTLLENAQIEGAESVGDGLPQKKLSSWRIRFESVKVKIGNTVTSVQLPTKAEQGKGVISV
ncbi:MAG: hypothetical protein M4579_006508 [Chaenotheca gracillima]|nr:MAG: hypothetical protein M4579_006508 [Chaenotheca gracillima]